MSFFDKLPEDVTVLIFKFVSRRPRNLYWKSSIGIAELSAFLSIAPGVIDQVKENMSSVLIAPEKNSLESSNSLFLHVLDNFEGVYPVLRLLCSHILQLRFQRFVIGPCNTLNRRFIEYLSKGCVNLKSLAFEDFMCDSDIELILRTRGALLEDLSLSFSGSVATRKESYWQFLWRTTCSDGEKLLPRFDIMKSTITYVAKYCKNLMRLELNDLACSNAEFWISIGKTLEELVLKFSPMFDCVKTLEFIEVHCRQLHSIEILDSANGFSLVESSAITKLYSSYGKRLLYANLFNVDPSCCSIVAANCPNIQVNIGHMFRLDEQINVFASMIVEVVFVHLWTNVDEERNNRLRESFENCTKVKKISSRVLGSYCLWSLDLFAAVFGRPMRELESFQWPKWLVDKNELGEAIHVISSSTRSLKEIDMAVENWELGMFKEMVDSNRNLQIVKLRLDSRTFYDMNVILDVLATFSTSQNLRHLIVILDSNEGNGRHIGTDFETITEFCWSIRRRDLYLKIGSTDYLP